MTREDAEILLSCAEIIDAVVDGHRIRTREQGPEPGSEHVMPLREVIMQLHCVYSALEPQVRAAREGQAGQ